MVQPKRQNVISINTRGGVRPSGATVLPKSRKSKILRILALAVALLVLVYAFLVMQVIQQQDATSKEGPAGPVIFVPQPGTRNTTTTAVLKNPQQKSKVRYYPDWRELAVSLAALVPSKILSTLEEQDPFGVRRLEEKLLQAESEKQAFLSLEELQTLFECPTTTGRITLPDQRNPERGRQFRNGTSNVFLFFQHLRKAGGTNFCTLAQQNLPKSQVPPYYCMPDIKWEDKNGRECGGCFSRFTNDEIATKMQAAGFRILGNEWDPFDASRFFELPAIYATSFRKPLDRALSQFRFECVENRGCKIKNITEWWDRRRDLTNVYTWTFAKQPVRRISIGTTVGDAQKRQEVVAKALDAVAQFHLVLVMEWLAYAPQHVQAILGFDKTHALTERVRPHITQFQRNDGQEHNQLGAAGIAKASWTPKEYLSPEQYQRMSENLALDEILTDAARRMFVERIVCKDL